MFETLEPRRVFASVVAYMYGNSLIIQGTAHDDVITVHQDWANTIVRRTDGVDILAVPTYEVAGISVFGYEGNDQIVCNGISLPCFLSGGEGDDILIGGNANDTLDGGDGNDGFDGGYGADSISGGAGQDLVSYQSRTRPLFVEFGSGNPTSGEWDWSTGYIEGDAIDSTCEELNTGSGDDYIVNTISATRVDIFAGDGNDTIYGSNGPDYIDAGNGNNLVYTRGGDDGVEAGWGDDRIYNSSRDDFFDAGAGNDYLVGSDTGNELIQGREGDDTILGGGGNDDLAGDAGKDSIDGGAGNDTIGGGTGSDSLVGDAGNDTIFGGEDGDTLIGGAGSDSLDGGAGDDYLYARDGANTDTVFGGDGFDLAIIDGFLIGTDRFDSIEGWL